MKGLFCKQVKNLQLSSDLKGGINLWKQHHQAAGIFCNCSEKRKVFGVNVFQSYLQSDLFSQPESHLSQLQPTKFTRS